MATTGISAARSAANTRMRILVDGLRHPHDCLGDDALGLDSVGHILGSLA